MHSKPYWLRSTFTTRTLLVDGPSEHLYYFYAESLALPRPRSCTASCKVKLPLKRRSQLRSVNALMKVTPRHRSRAPICSQGYAQDNARQADGYSANPVQLADILSKLVIAGLGNFSKSPGNLGIFHPKIFC